MHVPSESIMLDRVRQKWCENSWVTCIKHRSIYHVGAGSEMIGGVGFQNNAGLGKFALSSSGPIQFRRARAGCQPECKTRRTALATVTTLLLACNSVRVCPIKVCYRHDCMRNELSGRSGNRRIKCPMNLWFRAHTDPTENSVSTCNWHQRHANNIYLKDQWKHIWTINKF